VDIRLFAYELPPERIAQEPLPERDASRLLVLERATGRTQHRVFRELPELLREGDLVVTNRSRVLLARLLGRREHGGAAEVLLVRDLGGDRWQALLRPGKKLRAGTRITIDEQLSVLVETDEGALREVRLLVRAGDVGAALERSGHVPLPPYIRRPDRPQDRERYQTVYAREPGSVAAPTAGLHFTAAVLDCLGARGVARGEIVLHVGPGTFRPVEADQIEDHQVDPERFFIPPETAERIRDARQTGHRVVAVGTTTTRALEAAAEAEGGLRFGPGQTDLVIRPGHSFRLVDALLTNFHLPRSSLLLLVSAFAGREAVLDAYAEAIREGYRFYSYGDAMLIL